MVWRLDKGVRRSRNWWMELRGDQDGWICSRRDKAMLHKNMKIRPKRGNVENVRQGFKVEDEAGGIDGVFIDRKL